VSRVFRQLATGYAKIRAVGYLGRTTAGLGLLAAGLTAAEWALFELIKAGNCISNGDFLEDTGCFDKSGTWFVTIPIGLAIAAVGLAVFAARGRPPDADGSWQGIRAGSLGWAAGMAASGFTLIWAVAGPHAADVKSSVKTTGVLLGAALFPLAVYPLWRDLRSITAARGANQVAPSLPQPPPEPAWTPTPRPPPAAPPRATAPPQPAAPAPAPPSGTAIERLNALARDRDAGAITPEEFERQKAAILADMTRGL
jgi:hypothetical protein